MSPRDRCRRVVAFAIALAALPAAPAVAVNITIPVPLTVNGLPSGEIPLVLSESSEVLLVNAASLSRALGDILKPELLADIKAKTNADGFVAPGAITATGITFTYDSQAIKAAIEIPVPLQKTQLLAVQKSTTEPTGTPVPPSGLSARMNLRTRVDLYGQTVGGVGSTTVPFAAAVEPAVNLFGWVAEGRVSFDTSDTPVTSLDAARLVKDFSAPRIRVEAGDLNYPTAAFQNAIPLLGIGVTRNFALSPDVLFHPLGEARFELEQQSELKILVNDRLVRRYDLRPGPYSFYDFPLIPGTNNVVFELTDKLGRTERITQLFPYDSDLLSPGVFAYSANVGLPNRLLEVPVFSGLIRAGITPGITAGLSAQANIDTQLAALSGTFSTTLGTFRADAGARYDRTSGFDWGGSLGYHFYLAGVKYVPAVALNAIFSGRNFTGPASTSPTQSNAFVVGGSYSQGLPFGLSANLAVSQTIPWGASLPQTSVSLQVDKSVATGISLDFGVRADIPRGFAPRFSGSISLSTVNPGGTTSVTVNQDLGNGIGQVSMATRPTPDGNLTINAGASGMPLQPAADSTFSTSVGLQTSRFDSLFMNNLSLIQGSGGGRIVTEHASAQLGAAIAYAAGAGGSSSAEVAANGSAAADGPARSIAPGAFAIGAPIDDSFAIVAKNPGIANADIGVNPTENGYRARSDWLGAPMLSKLQSYQPASVHVEATSLTPGMDLGQTFFRLLPGFDSGTLIRVGTPATVYAGGKLLRSDGTAAALVTGSVMRSGEVAPEPGIDFFTDEQGAFQMYGLRPGTYRATISATPSTAQHAAAGPASFSFAIPEGVSGYYDLGTISIENGGSR